MYVPFELEIPRDLAGALNALAAGRDFVEDCAHRRWRPT